VTAPAKGTLHPTAWAAVVTLIVFALVDFASPNFRRGFDPSVGPYGGDFLQEWIGGYVVRTGQAARLYDGPFARGLQHDADLVGFDWSHDRYLPMVYPPFYYAAMSPLSLLPMPAAALVWAALMLLFLVAAQVLLARSLAAPAGLVAWLWPCAVLFAPLVENLTSNQKGTVLLFLFAATYVLLRRGRSFAAGGVFGLLAFKPQLAILVGAAMLWKRQWRFVAGAAATALALLLVSLAVGIDACRDYLSFIAGTPDYLQTAGYDLAKSHSWYGFFHLALGGAPDAAIRLASLGAVAATIGATVWLMAGPLQVRSSRFVAQYSGLVLASLLVSPHLLTYDLTVLLLPALLVGAELGAQGAIHGPVWRRTAAAVVVVLLVCNFSTPLARACGVQLSVPVMCAALVAITAGAKRRASPPATRFDAPIPNP
jgi:alpha-1,2-mannosyltransferase